MKRIFLYISIAFCFLGCNHKDLLWTEVVDDLDGRVTSLELICSEMNTNIAALQTIVDVLQSNDYITGIVEIKRDGVVIGYTITFGKHDPITIYHGQDGKDGQDGTDGKDGKDGADGITPQLKIEEGYWYISYDNGATWTQLGKATGEDGKDGQNGSNGTNGKDGQDGDSMFQSVTQDDNYVYFTLADGTVIKIAKSSNNQANDEYVFTITYDSNDGTNSKIVDTIFYGVTTKIKNCMFTQSGKYFSHWNSTQDGKGASYWAGDELMLSKNITIFAQWSNKAPSWGMEMGYKWVDLGLSVKWATHNVGATIPESYGDYFAWGEVYAKDLYEWSNYQHGAGTGVRSLSKYAITYKYSESPDEKSVLDACDDAAKVIWGGKWRMPSDTEWNELHSKCTWVWTSQNNVYGYKISASNGNSIFLPAAGYYSGASHYSANKNGYYWSNCLNGSTQLTSYYWYFDSTSSSKKDVSRGSGLSIRPVCP